MCPCGSSAKIPQELHRRDSGFIEQDRNIWVDPVSYAITPCTAMTSPPLRYKLEGQWYCSCPERREFHEPAMLPVYEVPIEGLCVTDIGPGKSIYTKKQLDESATFQDSQGTRRAYLAKTAELTSIRRNGNGE
jgi:hypothetical protein